MNSFLGRRYVTLGVISVIPKYIRRCIWEMLEIQKIEKKVLDYLLVINFELINDDINIIMSQEEPSLKTSLRIKTTEYLDDIINYTIYLIDNSNYVTMLLSDEY